MGSKSLLFCLCLVIFSQVSLASPSQVEVFDFHYHHDFEATDFFFERLNHPKNFYRRSGIVMMDSAYTIDVVRWNSDLADPSEITEHSIHQKLSDSLVTRDNIWGLCGADLRKPFVDHLENCLEMPRMIGVKLHLHAERARWGREFCGFCARHLISEKMRELDQVAEIVDSRGGVLLVHFLHHSFFARSPWPGRSLFGLGDEFEDAERVAFLQLVENYPNVKFVIAHSGVDSSMHPQNILKSLDGSSQKLPENLYWETSAIAHHAYKMAPCFDENTPLSVFADEVILPMMDRDQCREVLKDFLESSDSRELIQIWKKIGLDKILFGTDGPSPALTIESLQFVLGHPDLSDEEKRAILKENGMRLVQKVLRKQPR